MENNTLRDYLQVVFRHKIVIFVSIVLVIALTFVKVQLLTPHYTSSVRMIVIGQMTADVDYYKQISSFAGPLNHTMLMQSKPVLERVVRALKLYERPLDFGERRLASRIRKYFIDRSMKKTDLQLEQLTATERREFSVDYAIGKLAENMGVERLERSDLFELVVKDYDPELAPAIANSISRSYLIFDIENQIAELKLQYGDKNATIVKLNNYIQELYETLDGKPLSGSEAFGAASIKVISQARRSGMLIKPVNKKLVLAAAFLGSIFLGITLAFAIELLDETFKTPQELENILKIPYLGSIPKRKLREEVLISNINSKETVQSRAYQKISDQLFLLMKNKHLKSLLIIDAEGSDGTTAIIANLGIYLANKASNKVLIIDSNMRTPSVSKVFNISNTPGLADVLGQEIDFEVAVKDLGANLHVLPAGETEFNPVILLESSTFSDLIKTAKKHYDTIFFSCADIKHYSDAVICSSHMDGIVLVVNQGKVRRQVVKGAMNPLESKKVNMVGTILNNRTYSLPGIIYRLT